MNVEMDHGRKIQSSFLFKTLAVAPIQYIFVGCLDLHCPPPAWPGIT
jgi:hypothetical protein